MTMALNTRFRIFNYSEMPDLSKFLATKEAAAFLVFSLQLAKKLLDQIIPLQKACLPDSLVNS